MSTNTKKILILLIVLVICAGLTLGGKWLYERYASKIPEISQLVATEFNPGPLTSALDSALAAKTLAPEKILEWTNYYREQEGLKPLSFNNVLAQVAQAKADDLLARDYFEHVSPSGKDVADLVGTSGYQYALVGENLAMGGYQDEKDLVDAWMDSPGHRENILRPQFTEIGISARFGEYEGGDTWMAVQTFATPAPDCSLPNEALNIEIETKKAAYEGGAALVDRYNALVSEGASKIEAGNAKIKEGNDIATETRDNAAAQPYWDEGNSLQAEGQALLAQAETLKNDIDSRSTLYDSLQSLIADYNAQVEHYNVCINQIKL